MVAGGSGDKEEGGEGYETIRAVMTGAKKLFGFV